MATEVLGLYETREAADRAAQALKDAGYSSSNITVETYGNSNSNDIDTVGEEHESGWHRLLEKLHVSAPNEDVNYYHHGLNQGQSLVSVSASDDSAHPIADLLNNYGAIDIEEKSAAHAVASTNPTPYVGANPVADTADDTVIPIVQEELVVGKRSVSRGAVRVYQTVTEQPAEQQVSLRDEDIVVERHPVDRPATDADFQGQDFTLTETDEEAVVGKNARVVEEVVVGKTVQDRVENVSDTVRRTDVKVDGIDESVSPERNDDVAK